MIRNFHEPIALVAAHPLRLHTTVRLLLARAQALGEDADERREESRRNEPGGAGRDVLCVCCVLCLLVRLCVVVVVCVCRGQESGERDRRRWPGRPPCLLRVIRTGNCRGCPHGGGSAANTRGEHTRGAYKLRNLVANQHTTADRAMASVRQAKFRSPAAPSVCKPVSCGGSRAAVR
jgi:hypothetical protein